MTGRRAVEFLPGDPGLCPYGLPGPVYPDPFHRRKVDHQPAVRDRQAGDVVPAAADRYLGRLLAADDDRVLNIRDRAAPGDKRGPLVDQAVVDPPGLLVARLTGADQLAGERGGHLVGKPNCACHFLSPPCCAVRCHDPRSPPALLAACHERVGDVSRLAWAYVMLKAGGGQRGKLGVRAARPGRGAGGRPRRTTARLKAAPDPDHAPCRRQPGDPGRPADRRALGGGAARCPAGGTAHAALTTAPRPWPCGGRPG